MSLPRYVYYTFIQLIYTHTLFLLILIYIKILFLMTLHCKKLVFRIESWWFWKILPARTFSSILLTDQNKKNFADSTFCPNLNHVFLRCCYLPGAVMWIWTIFKNQNRIRFFKMLLSAQTSILKFPIPSPFYPPPPCLSPLPLSPFHSTTHYQINHFLLFTFLQNTFLLFYFFTFMLFWFPSIAYEYFWHQG